MIKAEDLRVNNYILVDGIQDRVTGVFHEMSVDNEFYYVQAANKLDYSLDQVEPIPLNEEWLIKLGFEKSETGIYMEKWNLFTNGDLVLHWRNRFCEFGWVESIEVKYVHEAQNLFFALTGTELTTKP